MTTILIAGKTGQVGWELQRALPAAGNVIALDRKQMDLTSADSIRNAIRRFAPDIIVNAAGYTAVDKAESEPDLTMQVNGIAPGIMAEEAKRAGAQLIHYSTDYVFDGSLERPYVEDDIAHPVNKYGESKLAGERAIEAVGGAYAILRTSWIYGHRGNNFVLTMMRLGREKKELAVVVNQTGSPTWSRSLAESTADLIRKRELIVTQPGVYHLSANGHASRYEFAKLIIDLMKEFSGKPGDWANVKPVSSDHFPLPAKRPPNPVTSKDKIKRVFGTEMTDWQTQLKSCLQEIHSKLVVQKY